MQWGALPGKTPVVLLSLFFPSSVLQAFATRNFTTRLAGICRLSGLGVTTIRAFRLTSTSCRVPAR